MSDEHSFFAFLQSDLDEFGGKDILYNKFRRLKETLSLISFIVQTLKNSQFGK